MAEALYRKYRPQVFEDVVGQEPIERTLKNAIAQDKVSHAYLFCGPRGTGKTTTARLLAKALMCQAGPTPDPDGTCEDCRLIAEGVHPDVYELDAASRTGVENVREEIISRVQFAPTRGRNKVYIIDEVHMLSTAAFNALLKTLEEPPSHVIFVLCTTDPQKVPETIHSRCQRFDFRRIAPESMVSRLGAICIAEGVEFEGEALDLIAHRAEGGLRNALTSLEQIIAFENGKVTLAGAERLLGSIDSNDMAEIVAFVGRRDIANCFRWTADYVETGADLAQFVRDMAEHVRNLYVLALVGDDADLDITETTRHQMAIELQWFGPDRLARLLGVLGDLSAELKTSSNPRLAFEIALTRMVRPDSDLTLESLAERIEALESGYSSVAHVLPGQPLHVAAPADEPVAAASAWASPEPSREVDEPQRQPQQSRPVAQPQPAVDHTPEPMEPAPQPQSQSQEPVQTEFAPAPSADDERLAALANPASMQRIWQAVLSAVKKQKQAYGVLFMNTKARFDADAATVRISFPAEAAFAFNAVQKPDVQEALASAFQKSVGIAVPFLLEQAGQDGSASVRPAVNEGSVRKTAQVQERLVQELQPAPAPQSQPASELRAQPAPEPQPQPARETQQQPAYEPQPQPVREPQPQPIAQPVPEPQRQAQVAPSSDDYPPYEAVPYEEVPYEEVPYEEVPYEELAGKRQGADAATRPSPDGIESHLTPEGNIVEDPADVEALLQAGFGGGVVFSEVDE